MSSPFPAQLFADGRPLVYRISLQDKAFVTQWTVYRGRNAAGLHELALYAEIDPTAVGQGGSVVHPRSVHLCDDGLRPVRHESRAMGACLTLQIDGDAVTAFLPDGTQRTVALGGADYLYEAHMPGLQALMLAAAHQRGRLDEAGGASWKIFIANSLVSLPYAVRPETGEAADDGSRRFTSSHKEEIVLDADGVMRSMHTPSDGQWTKRVDPPPPLPAWRDELATQQLAQLPRYEPPASDALRLEDGRIAGPVTPIGATLSLPATGDGPFPGVLFLSGSGPHDRHGFAGELDIGTHEVMDALAAHGFVGLRYDKRGTGTTALGEDFLEHGLEAIVADAEACFAFLRERPQVDADRVFLIGHSEGGTVALRLALAHPDQVHGVVLMASPGRRADQLMADQIVGQCAEMGLDDAQVAEQLADFRALVALVESGQPWDEDNVPDHLFGYLHQRPWLEDHLKHYTAEMIRSIACPVLICQGEQDFQVLPDKDGKLLHDAATEAGRDVTFRLFPQLDHLFKATERSTMAQYFDRSRRVDAGFIEEVRAWLEAHA